MYKQCCNCRKADKPNKQCACNDKVKSASEVVPMKYNGNGFSYCDGFKPIYKG